MGPTEKRDLPPKTERATDKRPETAERPAGKPAERTDREPDREKR